MIITRRSPLTGKFNDMDLPITQEQMDKYAKFGYKVQDAFPHLNADQREFIMTGYTKEDWDKMFPRLEKRTHREENEHG